MTTGEPARSCSGNCPAPPGNGNAGLILNAAAGLWWADPVAALVLVGYALREAREIFRPRH